MKLQTRTCLSVRNRWLVVIALSIPILLLGTAWYSTTQLVSVPDGERRSLTMPIGSFAPFLHIVPSADGRELYINAGGAGILDGEVFVNIGIGPGHREGSYTMAYSETVQAYFATAIGFTPEFDDHAPINITTTFGLDTGSVRLDRAYVQASTPRPIISRDDNLELELVNTDTITRDTYIAVVPSYAPPGPAPLGHRFVGSAYSVRAAGAMTETNKPMLLRLCYNEITLAGADPHTLAIFAWDTNPSNKHWDKLGGQLFYSQRHVSVATSRFATYALIATPAWRDNFDDFSGLAEISNVTLGLQGDNRTLVSSSTPGTGTAVSRLITPTTAFAGWGTLTFTRTVDPPTTTLTVDVLSLGGTELMTDVTSGASLAGIDPVQYPGLKLRANLSSTVAGETPALDEWRVTWRVGKHVYLPVVLE